MDWKATLTSKTIWGLLITVATPFASKHGLVLDEGIVADGVTLAGAVLALWGRITAKRPLTVKPL